MMVTLMFGFWIAISVRAWTVSGQLWHDRLM